VGGRAFRRPSRGVNSIWRGKKGARKESTGKMSSGREPKKEGEKKEVKKIQNLNERREQQMGVGRSG